MFVSAAAVLLIQQQLHGREIRQDGFFAGNESNGADFIEGVMLSAMDSFEQRKVPYLGNLIANVAFADTVDDGAANSALRIADELSWTEMKLLGVFADPEKFPMPHRKAPTGWSWASWNTLDALTRLLDRSRTLLMYTRTRVEPRGLPSYDLNLDAIKFASGGTLATTLMELDTIPERDRREVFDTVTTSPLEDLPIPGT